MRSSSFRIRVIAGYAVVIVILVTGMFYAIARIDALASSKLATVRAAERDITSVERLRWHGEVMISSARGYALSGEREHRVRLEEAAVALEDDALELAMSATTPLESELVARVRRTAEEFRSKEREFVNARAKGEDVGALFARYQPMLAPLRRDLAQSIDALVRHKEARIAAVYRETEQDQARLIAWLYLLVGVLALSSFGVAALFARQLVRAHEGAQRAVHRAHEAIEERDEIMGIVAHDLRNPLGSIALRAALLEQIADTEAVRRHASSIADVTTRMEGLIGSMLDVSTLEAGRFAIEPTRVGIDEILRAAFDVFEGMARSRHVRLEGPPGEIGAAVHADKDRVLQVLSNLLGNAIKFTPPGGSVRVSVDRQRGFMRFSVSDTGPGIEPDDIAHLFDRFWQRRKRGTKGAGLGLFIARGIVQAHGGRIWAESEPGRGTTLRFTLPLAPEPSPAPSPAAPLVPATSHRTG